MKFRFLVLFIGLLFSLILPEVIYAQQAEIRYANQLFRNGEYEQAFELYRELLNRNPDNLTVVDRKSSGYISLKRYDDAIRVLSAYLERNPDQIQLGVRIGEAHHMAGNRDKALLSWKKLLENNPRNIQGYRHVAETMSSRREYEEASLVLMEARNIMGNQQLFAFEIARYFTAGGSYEKAMREYSQLIINNPAFIPTIQRQIARHDEDFFRDAAIMEFEEISRELTPGSEEWIAHREMLIWLYMERELFRRALATARNLEDRIDDDFPTFTLGRNLANLNEFEMAETAFQRYSNNPEHILHAESREQLALLYITQARYLIDNNLDFGHEAGRLYQQAYDLLAELENGRSGYSIQGNVLVLLTEISLDYLKDGDIAQQWIKRYENLRGRQANPVKADYLRGRLYMFEQDFARARIQLTRSNRAARTGDLAEKSRYFLSLNDFYAGDFEFAKIQMRSLRRQSTSYYANNALRLQGWLQDGMVQDSATTELRQFSKAQYLFDSGNSTGALETLLPFFEASNTPLESDALLLTGKILRKNHPGLGFALLDHFIEAGTRSTQMEQIMWMRARLADAMVHLEPDLTRETFSQKLFEQYMKAAGLPSDDPSAGFSSRFESKYSLDLSYIIDLYEDILMKFPQGFYGAPVRERIRNLQQTALLP